MLKSLHTKDITGLHREWESIRRVMRGSILCVGMHAREENLACIPERPDVQQVFISIATTPLSFKHTSPRDSILVSKRLIYPTFFMWEDISDCVRNCLHCRIWSFLHCCRNNPALFMPVCLLGHLCRRILDVYF